MKKRLLAVWLLVVMLGWAGPGQGATIVVDTLVDVVANDGLCSLREAITNANGANQSGSTDCAAGEADGNVIEFAPGLAGNTIVLNGTALPTITRSLTIRGPVSADWSGLTIDGNDQVRIFRMDAGFNGNFSATIRDLTLTNGRTDELNQPGGALWIRNVDLVLDHVNIHGNRTTGPSSLAGAFWITGGQVQMIDSRLANNTAQNIGGGIVVNNASLWLMRTTISGNHSPSGVGAINVQNGELNMFSSTVSANTATGSTGGLSLVDSNLLAVNSTISGNSAGSGAGAIYVTRGEAVLVHTTVAFNTAPTIHGIFLLGAEDQPASLELVNSLVVQAEPGHVACNLPSAFTSITSVNSLATHANCTGSATAPSAINLAALADNGGPTRTHALQAGSLALNGAGDCTADWELDHDQRGLQRPGGQSAACDVGAYEAQEALGQADLLMSKTVQPSSAATGDTVVFTLSVSNLGPDPATGVVVSDQLPPGYQYTGSSAGQGSYDAATGLWQIGALANDGSVELTIEATINPVGPYLNVATASADTFDPVADNNQAEAEVTIVEPQADLAVGKQVNPTQADIGATVTFTVIAVNQGPDDATGVEVLDQLPDGYEFVSASATGGSFDANTGLWTIGNLNQGASATLTIQAAVTAVNDYLNTASISGDQVDPDSSNNSASAGISLPPPVADPIIVTTLDDVVANDGQCSLREAILNANGANQSGSVDCGSGGSDGNLIRIAPGLIGGTITVNPVVLPNITRPLRIEGPEAGNPAGISLNGSQLGRVLGVTSGADLELADLTITGGRATLTSGGGGVSVNSAGLKLERVLISGNATEGGAGAGLSLSGGDLLVIDSSIMENNAASQGGGVHLVSATATIRNSTIAGNLAGNSGGGIHLQSSSLTLLNSTVSGNHTEMQSGALHMISSTAEVIHSTLAFNSADLHIQGVGLTGTGTGAQSANLALHNSLVLQEDPAGAACFVGAFASLESSGSLSTHSGCTGSATSLADIAIGPLTGNGGLTRTHALGSASAAIGLAGNCPFAYGLLSDQRGQPRPGGQSTACDAGAYESQFMGDAIFRDQFREQD